MILDPDDERRYAGALRAHEPFDVLAVRSDSNYLGPVSGIGGRVQKRLQIGPGA